MKKSSKQTNYTANLKALGRRNSLCFGAKAENLSTLINANVLVPRGFCISMQGLSLFLTHNSYTNKINIHQICDSGVDLITRVIRSGEFPQELHEEIVSSQKDILPDTKLFAVRSSGIWEDSPDFSFAGQYHTALNVQEAQLLEAIKDCWMSLFSPHVINYVTNKKLPNIELGGGVIIQEMLIPAISGVLFTKNPLTDNDSEICLETVS